MKAKEYAKRLHEQGITNENVANVVRDFLLEVTEIGKSRNAVKNESLFRILEEQDSKWQALCRIIPDIANDGFRVALKIASPATYREWEHQRLRSGKPLPEIVGLIQ